jgi:hypothetical protein
VKGTYLEAMFSGRWNHKLDETGRIFLDFDPYEFSKILAVLRNYRIGGSKFLTDGMKDAPAVCKTKTWAYVMALDCPLFISNIVIGMDDLFKQWFDGRYNTSKKGYESVDDLDANRFHATCDYRGPTLTLICARNGHLFGGYNPHSWTSSFLDSPDGSGSDRAFIFTLKNPTGLSPTRYFLKEGCPIATNNSPVVGPVFGRKDILCAADGYSRIAFPQNYEDTTGYGFRTFTGSGKFSIKQIEVFALRFAE